MKKTIKRIFSIVCVTVLIISTTILAFANPSHAGDFYKSSYDTYVKEITVDSFDDFVDMFETPVRTYNTYWNQYNVDALSLFSALGYSSEDIGYLGLYRKDDLSSDQYGFYFYNIFFVKSEAQLYYDPNYIIPYSTVKSPSLVLKSKDSNYHVYYFGYSFIGDNGSNSLRFSAANSVNRVMDRDSSFVTEIERSFYFDDSRSEIMSSEDILNLETGVVEYKSSNSNSKLFDFTVDFNTTGQFSTAQITATPTSDDFPGGYYSFCIEEIEDNPIIDDNNPESQYTVIGCNYRHRSFLQTFHSHGSSTYRERVPFYYITPTDPLNVTIPVGNLFNPEIDMYGRDKVLEYGKKYLISLCEYDKYPDTNSFKPLHDYSLIFSFDSPLSSTPTIEVPEYNNDYKPELSYDFQVNQGNITDVDSVDFDGVNDKFSNITNFDFPADIANSMVVVRSLFDSIINRMGIEAFLLIIMVLALVGWFIGRNIRH